MRKLYKFLTLYHAIIKSKIPNAFPGLRMGVHRFFREKGKK